VKGLAERAEAIRSGRVDPREDNMLKITTEGRKAALDLRC
jgi:N12 class adenine-specific DNA methylase